MRVGGWGFWWGCFQVGDDVDMTEVVFDDPLLRTPYSYFNRTLISSTML
jgi:hypothetical protein